MKLFCPCLIWSLSIAPAPNSELHRMGYLLLLYHVSMGSSCVPIVVVIVIIIIYLYPLTTLNLYLLVISTTSSHYYLFWFQWHITWPLTHQFYPQGQKMALERSRAVTYFFQKKNQNPRPFRIQLHVVLQVKFTGGHIFISLMINYVGWV